VIESAEICFEIADHLLGLGQELKIPVMFKGSFDKANRQSISSYRGPGIKQGLAILSEVRKRTGLGLVCDVHEVQQVGPASEVLDIIQIPAFLCRQTDLLTAVGKSGKCVNIKKGQFMAPEQMKDAVAKVTSMGNEKVLLTERGSCFGYGRLINDMSAIALMREFAPVIFDATHSTQQPGGTGSGSGGQPEFATLLARSAVAAGVDGLFVETHPQPARAKCDATTMLPLEQLEALVSQCIAIRKIVIKG
jgi:2-dehydro-3-deoxyphosphooctonate aldolase (KDO 8-P synthase)